MARAAEITATVFMWFGRTRGSRKKKAVTQTRGTLSKVSSLTPTGLAWAIADARAMCNTLKENAPPVMVHSSRKVRSRSISSRAASYATTP